MTDTDEYRCPTCGATDLVVIHTAAIGEELLRCEGCLDLYEVERDGNGTAR